MKKVAFVVRLFQDKAFYAGSEKFVYKIIGEFIKNDFVVDVYCHELFLGDSRVFTGNKPPKVIENVNGINKIVLCEDNVDLANEIIAEKYYSDLQKMISNNYDAVIIDGITLMKGVTLLQVHSPENKRYNLKNPFVFLYYFLFTPKIFKNINREKKWLNSNDNKIITVSEILKKDCVENYKIDKNRLFVVYPAVDFSETIEKNTDKNVLTFGISATFFKRKGGLLFIRALHRVKKVHSNFKAFIILRKTTGSKMFWFKTLLKVLNLEENIEFLPFQKSMDDFYKKIDLLVMPSKEEAFGLVALEAMINKIPCIVSSCSGVAEIIEDGKDGFVFDIDKSACKNLADKIKFVIENPQIVDKCVDNAFEKAKVYNWQKTYCEICKTIFGEETKNEH